MSKAAGILGFGAYVPRYRLRRAAAVAANRWFAPGIAAAGKGYRSFCNWDEDAVTMALEAARSCGVEGCRTICLASTTLPFEDRNHAGIVGDALNLGSELRLQDVGGSRRAGTTALLEALERPAQDDALIIASECRDPLPASVDELRSGHGAAAVKVGAGTPLARLVASSSRHEDLVDRYRADAVRGDYILEERWVREEGLRAVLATQLRSTLADAGIGHDSISHLVLPVPDRQAQALAHGLGLEGASRPAWLDDTVGSAGVAQPLLGLVAALETARAGDRILVAGFGQGADVLVFEAQPSLDARAADAGLQDVERNTSEEDNYLRYLALRGRLHLGLGIRFERDNRTAQSTFYRKRAAITGFVGGRCPQCETLQYPATATCVACREGAEMVPESLSGLIGTVKSFTEDWQAATPRPPLIFGSVDFPGDATVVMEFTDAEPGSLAVGDRVRMMFRIKDIDERRGFRRYFWKPAPLAATAGEVRDGR